jgi:hypothetical protein
MDTNSPRTVFWHSELPPLEADAVAEHTVEADSERVTGSFTRRDERWQHCYGTLMHEARARLMQEITRLGGDYAHVLSEHVEQKHNYATREAWLHGVFTYTLFRRREPGVGPARR